MKHTPLVRTELLDFVPEFLLFRVRRSRFPGRWSFWSIPAESVIILRVFPVEFTAGEESGDGAGARDRARGSEMREELTRRRIEKRKGREAGRWYAEGGRRAG